MISVAINKSDFFEKLGTQGETVGPKSGPNRRTKQDEEAWLLRRLFSNLVEKNQINWPLTIKQSDKPDAIISEGHTEYGLEITSAISQNDAREIVEAEKADIGVYSIGTFGGSSATSSEAASFEFIQNIQAALNKKASKPYVKQRPTDLLIYVRGNNSFWLDSDWGADDDCNEHQNAVCNYSYKKMEHFRRVFLYWNSGKLFSIGSNT